MATPGGPEQIGAVNIGVEANIAPLISDLEKAKQQAAQKGEEIGRAAKEGVEKGSAGGAGGSSKWNYATMHGPSDSDIATERFRREMGEAKDAIDELAEAEKRANATGTLPMADGIEVLTAKMTIGIAVAAKYMKMMDDLGNQLAKTWKDMQMLEEAMHQSSRLQDRGFGKENDRLDRASAGASPFEREEMASLLSDAEDRASRGRTLQDSAIKDRLSWGGRVSLGLERATGGLWTAKSTQDIARGNELVGRARSDLDKLHEMENRLLESRSTGTAFHDEAERRGIDAPDRMRLQGTTLSPSAMSSFQDALRGMSSQQFELQYKFMTQSWQQNEDTKTELRRTGRVVPATQSR